MGAEAENEMRTRARKYCEAGAVNKSMTENAAHWRDYPWTAETMVQLGDKVVELMVQFTLAEVRAERKRICAKLLLEANDLQSLQYMPISDTARTLKRISKVLLSEIEEG
jgi:hypothetical protein